MSDRNSGLRRKKIEVNAIEALPQLTIRLDINPTITSNMDDKLILYGGDFQGYSYKQIKSVKDDSIPDDTYVDLVFTGLKKDLLYWLVHDCSNAGTRYFMYRALSYNQLESIAVEE